MDFDIYDDDITHGAADVFGRGAAREASIWGAFQFNGPFPTLHSVERTILFGIYANTYLHGMNYLSEINDISLTQMIANYDNDIARLENEEAQLVLEIVAKRYLESIDDQIHRYNMDTGYRKIDALNAEYDARTAALAADYAAIVTKQVELQNARDRAAQRISELQTRVLLEGAAQDMVDIEITEQQLKSARADLELIEAGIRGLDIQLAITQTGLDIANIELQIAETETRVDEIGLQVTETELQESGVDLDIISADIDLSKAEVAGSKTQADTRELGLKTSETLLDIAETEAKQSDMTAQIAGVNADIAKLSLVDSELTIAQADLAVTTAENALLVAEKGIIDSQQDNVTTEKGFIETQQTTQEALDALILSNDQGEHDFAVTMLDKETVFEDSIRDKKLPAFDAKKTLADEKKELRLEDADYRRRLFVMEGDIKNLRYQNEIANFQLIQDADIVNELTHSIGQA